MIRYTTLPIGENHFVFVNPQQVVSIRPDGPWCKVQVSTGVEYGVQISANDARELLERGP